MQQAKQLGILRSRNRPYQRLQHMVVRADHSGHDQMPACVNYLVSVFRQVRSVAYGFNEVVAYKSRCLAPLPEFSSDGVVKGGDKESVFFISKVGLYVARRFGVSRLTHAVTKLQIRNIA